MDPRFCLSTLYVSHNFSGYLVPGNIINKTLVPVTQQVPGPPKIHDKPPGAPLILSWLVAHTCTCTLYISGQVPPPPLIIIIKHYFVAYKLCIFSPTSKLKVKSVVYPLVSTSWYLKR